MKNVRLAHSFLFRFKWRVTLALGIALLIIILSIVLIRSQNPPADEGVAILRGDYIAAHITDAALRSLPASSVHSRGETYTAAAVRDVLEQCGAMPTLYESVTFTGEDTLLVTGQELLTQPGIYLAYETSGQAISSQEGGPYLLLYITPEGETARVRSLREARVNLQE